MSITRQEPSGRFHCQALDELAASLEAGPARLDIPCSTWRLMAICAIPALCGVLLVRKAGYYQQIIPPGDATFRALLVTACLLLSAGAVTLILATVWRHGRHRLQVAPDALAVQRLSTFDRYRWDEVVIGFPTGLAGFRRLTILTPGGQAIMDELLYPSFGEAYSALVKGMETRRRVRASKPWSRLS